MSAVAPSNTDVEADYKADTGKLQEILDLATGITNRSRGAFFLVNPVRSGTFGKVCESPPFVVARI